MTDKIMETLMHHTSFSSLPETEREHIVEELEYFCREYAQKVADELQYNQMNEDAYDDTYEITLFNLLSYIDPDEEKYAGKIVQTMIVDKRDFAAIFSTKIQNLFPEKFETYNRKETVVNLRKKNNILFRCKKCGSVNTITKNNINRSGDEGVNLRVECQECPYAWNC